MRRPIEAATGMLGGSFGGAGHTIVIEEFLRGEEVSFIVIASDQSVLPLATSQDHKRRDDGDQGPNTGGMGAYSPAPIVTPALHARIMREVIEPTLRGLRADGNPYLGFLYAGLMIAADGTPNVLEFNCRFGDPETQPILMRLQSDLVDLCEAALAGAGALDRVDARWDPRAALGVVMAAGGYPDAYRKGDPISGLDAAARLPGKVFHAGTGTPRRRRHGKPRKSSPPAGACSVPWAWATASPPRSTGLRTRARHPLEPGAVPPRHRLSRHRARNCTMKLAGWREPFAALRSQNDSDPVGSGDRLAQTTADAEPPFDNFLER